QSVALAFSPDSKQLVAAGGNDIEVWAVDSGSKLRDLHFPGWNALDNGNACVAVSKDDVVAVGQRGGAIRLWNLSSGAEPATTNAHPRTVWDLAFSPDGQKLATASFDQTIKLWDVASLRTLATLQGH